MPIDNSTFVSFQDKIYLIIRAHSDSKRLCLREVNIANQELRIPFKRIWVDPLSKDLSYFFDFVDLK